MRTLPAPQGIRFKTGPPPTAGAEIEQLIHAVAHPARPLNPVALSAALDDDAPLPGGSTMHLGAGGQLIIRAAARPTLCDLHAAAGADLAHVERRLDRAGLRLGGTGIDAHRAPRRLTAMQVTAGLTPIIAAGHPRAVPAAHDVGPTLLAVFANSPVHARRATGWASTRMRAWYDLDPTRAGVVVVRPGGHLRLRYLDAQPAGDWFAPVAVAYALLSSEDVAGAAQELVAPAAGRWLEAARYGLTDPVIAATAPALLDLAWRTLGRLGLPPALRTEVATAIERRFQQSH